MYSISALYDAYLHKRNRDWLVKVNIAGTDYGSSVIVDFTVENDMSGQLEFELGTTILSKLTLRLKTSAVIPPNARVIPYVALQLPPDQDGANVAWQDVIVAWQDADFPWWGGVTEWMPLGEFYVDSRQQINNIWEFACYDKLVYADVPYVSALTYPATQQAVWDEICTSLAYTYDSSVVINPGYMIQAGPAGYTKRQVLGYIASANAACVYISKDGKIRFRCFGATDVPVTAMTTADYIKVKQTNPLKTYTRIAVTYNTEDGLTYSAGTGDNNHTLRIENPFATQAVTNDLLNRLNGFSYVPFVMPARGYPQLEVGDRIRFGKLVDSPAWQDADIAWQDADYSWDGYADGGITVALNQVFTFKGGLKMSLAAPSKSEQLSEFVVEGTLQAQVNRLNKSAVREARSYFGATLTRTEGLTIERVDHASKVILNSDKMTFQVGGVDKIYFDPVTGKYKLNGTLEAVDGVFSGSLSAATGTFSGQLVAATGTFNGVYSGLVKANQIDVSEGRIIAAQIDATNLHVSSANIDGTITADTVKSTWVYAGNLTAGQIIAGTLTGFTIQTASSGSRLILSGSTFGAYNGNTADGIVIDGSAGNGKKLTWYDAGTGYAQIILVPDNLDSSKRIFQFWTIPGQNMEIIAGKGVSGAGDSKVIFKSNVDFKNAGTVDFTGVSTPGLNATAVFG